MLAGSNPLAVRPTASDSQRDKTALASEPVAIYWDSSAVIAGLLAFFVWYSRSMALRGVLR